MGCGGSIMLSENLKNEIIESKRIENNESNESSYQENELYQTNESYQTNS